MIVQTPFLEVADFDLPSELERLRELDCDLWWSFNPRASRTFASIDPDC